VTAQGPERLNFTIASDVNKDLAADRSGVSATSIKTIADLHRDRKDRNQDQKDIHKDKKDLHKDPRDLRTTSAGTIKFRVSGMKRAARDIPCGLFFCLVTVLSSCSRV